MVTRPLTLLALCGALVVLAGACDWTEYMGNPALNGNASSETSITTTNVGTLSETFRVTADSAGGNVSSPVVSQGTVFVTTADGSLVAASASGQTGCSGSPKPCAPLWTAPATGYEAIGSPVVANGVVYQTIRSATDADAGLLEAFDASGSTGCAGTPTVCQPLWTAPADVYWGPNVADGKVFVDTLHNGLEVFDAAGSSNCGGTPRSCQPLWTTTPASASLSVPSISGGKVYLTTDEPSAVEVFDENGSTGCTGAPAVCSPLFTVPLTSTTGTIGGSVDVSGGIGYVVSPENGNSALSAFDATGSTGCTAAPVVCEPLWSASISGRAFGTPAVANGRVYVSSEAAVHVFDASGKQGCSGAPPVCSPEFYLVGGGGDAEDKSPTVAGPLVYVGGQAFDAAGSVGCSGPAPVQCAPLWTAPGVTAGVTASTTVANGTVYVSGDDGLIRAYHLPAT